MNVKEKYNDFNKKMPHQIATIDGQEFQYRYYDNPNSDVTIIFLAGGSGLGDGGFMLYDSFLEKYSLMCFNYPLAFKTNKELADALAKLINELGLTNVYLVGQSYGGLFAQVMAKEYPSVIKGLILSGTCSMSNDLTYEGIHNITKFINPKKLKRNLMIDRLIPGKFFIPLMKLAFWKHAPDKKMARMLSDIVDVLKVSITSEYWCHMDMLLGDLMNEFGRHKPSNFMKYDNEVLLFFSEEDKIFCDDLKGALIRLMPENTKIANLVGGHLSLFVDFEGYCNEIFEFLDARN